MSFRIVVVALAAVALPPALGSSVASLAAERAINLRIAGSRLVGELNGSEHATSVAASEAGNVYVVGQTKSSDLENPGSFQPKYGGGPSDAFIVCLRGGDLVPLWFSYLGGNDAECARGIAVDREGSIWVVGGTGSKDFPVKRPLSKAHGGGNDAFVVKLDASGKKILFSTLLGGAADDEAGAVVVDTAGSPIVTGVTNGPGFPLAQPIQKEYAGGKPMPGDAFVTKLAADGSSMVFSTYLGGDQQDSGNALAVDTDGNTYVVGTTWSRTFPVHKALQGAAATPKGVPLGIDGFVTKMASDGRRLEWSTYLGGAQGDIAFGVAVDAKHRVWVGGITASADFPVQSPWQKSDGGKDDGFVCLLSADGKEILRSSFLGGTSADMVRDLKLGRGGLVHVVGRTNSPDFPLHRPFQGTFRGPEVDYGDAFIAVIDPETFRVLHSSFIGGNGPDFALAMSLGPGGTIHVIGTTASGDFCEPEGAGAGEKPSVRDRTAFVMELSATGEKQTPGGRSRAAKDSDR